MNRILLYCFFIFLFVFSQPIISQWKYLGLNSEQISSIAVDTFNPNIIYAGSLSDYSSGIVGGIFKSTDGGANWDTLVRGVTVKSIVFHPNNSSIIYSTLELNGLTPTGIIKSTDNGNTWMKADSGMYLSFEEGAGPIAIDPIHPDTLYAGTVGIWGGKLYRSVNGGMLWTSLGDTTYLRLGVTAIAIHPQNTNIIYAGTSGAGKLLRSTDYGVGWVTIDSVEGGIIYDIEYDPLNSQNIFCGSHRSGILNSSDGGYTWNKINQGLPDNIAIENIQILYAENLLKIFIATHWTGTSDLYHSINGNSWTLNGIQSRTLTQCNGSLYSGFNGVYVNDNPLFVNEENQIETLSFTLHQNYPNPFNPTTTISFDLSHNGLVKLKIYDVLGREVSSLIYEYLGAGDHSEVFDASNLSSGVYIYKLILGNSIAIRKMIFLR